jgi:hypothetical protein
MRIDALMAMRMVFSRHEVFTAVARIQKQGGVRRKNTESVKFDQNIQV